MVFEIIFGEEVLIVFIILAYLFFFLVARTLFIAIPWRNWILSQIDSMRNNICVEQNFSEVCPQLRTNILTQANDLLVKAENLINWNWGFFFWSGSYEVAALSMVYEADRHVVRLLSQDDLCARIKRATGEIEELPEKNKMCGEQF
ncbi:Uncharacterised protein [uncultured archaeon]|nr:Uncharacterised protein [uncultured archaeon]